MRSLQAHSELDGAYDARSLCHKVLVPFEKNEMQGRLGASNEPFLNKPARFPEVSLENAVRKGRDRDMLEKLYGVLERLNKASSNQIFEAFLYGIKATLNRPTLLANEISFPPINITQADIIHLIFEYLTNCSGGETAASAYGALLRLLETPSGNRVKIHPANQAGSSSNEVGDIDVYNENILLYAVEVKDKIFSGTDIDHAIQKVKEYGNGRLIFAMGMNASASPTEINVIERKAQEHASNGFDISFVRIDEQIQQFLGYANYSQRLEFVKEIAVILDEMRATDMTKSHYRTVFSHLADLD
jgi:hypothetical protein